MKGSLAAFDRIGGRGAAARVVDGRLEDLLIDPPDDRIRPGAVYRARAGRPMKGQGGMILETPDGPLFLRQSKGVRPGDTLLVQASSYAEAGKASPATARLLFKSRFCLVTPGAEGLNISKAIRDEERRVELRELLDEVEVPEGVGLVLRTSCEGADDAAVMEDLVAVLGLARDILAEPLDGAPELLMDGPGAEELAFRDWPVPDTTDDEPGSFARCGIDEMIEDLRQPREPLPGGGFFFVEPTRALVAVDVNTGTDTSPAAGLKANIETLRALPRALRLRGLAGQVVLDLAPLSKRDRRGIESAANAAFRADPIETSLVGWTPLGHLEINRKRERLPLSECLK